MASKQSVWLPPTGKTPSYRWISGYRVDILCTLSISRRCNYRWLRSDLGLIRAGVSCLCQLTMASASCHRPVCVSQLSKRRKMSSNISRCQQTPRERWAPGEKTRLGDESWRTPPSVLISVSSPGRQTMTCTGLEMSERPLCIFYSFHISHFNNCSVQRWNTRSNWSNWSLN